MTEETMLNYVMISHGRYDAAVKALQVFDVINDILDRAPESEQIRMIRIVMGKEDNHDE